MKVRNHISGELLDNFPPLDGPHGPMRNPTLVDYAAAGWNQRQDVVIPAGHRIVSGSVSWQLVGGVDVQSAQIEPIPSPADPLPLTMEHGVHIPHGGLLVVDDANDKGWAIAPDEDGTLVIVGPVHGSPWKRKEEIAAMLVEAKAAKKTKRGDRFKIIENLGNGNTAARLTRIETILRHIAEEIR